MLNTLCSICSNDNYQHFESQMAILTLAPRCPPPKKKKNNNNNNKRATPVSVHYLGSLVSLLSLQNKKKAMLKQSMLGSQVYLVYE